jgi:Cu/Ag efflux protein CusF
MSRGIRAGVTRATARLLSALIATAPAAICVTSCAKPTAAAPRSWHATGAVRGFGPARAYVNIAHDDIPGYMTAMTMSFEPERPQMLDGVSVGDRVAIDFFETEDARRVLTRVERRP